MADTGIHLETNWQNFLRPELHDQVFYTIFLLSFLPDGNVWVFQQTNCRSYQTFFFCFFFAVKAFMQYLTNLKFAIATVILCALSIHCHFSLAKMIQASSQKWKAAAIVINSCLSSAAKCVNFFFRSAMKWNRLMKDVKISLLVWNSVAYSIAFFLLCYLSSINLHNLAWLIK